jgi:hypothetical protein
MLRRTIPRLNATSTLLYLGATGFPPNIYTPMLHHLVDNSDSISGFETHSYNPLLDPLPGDWQPLIDGIKAKAVEIKATSGQPLKALGHSGGGALLLATANQNPRLFDGGLLVYDPPLFSEKQQFLMSLGFRFVPNQILNNLHPLIKSSLRKKGNFVNRKEAREWAASKKLLKSFDPSIFEAFVAHNFVRADRGDNSAADKDEIPLILDFTGQQEANMYRSTPADTPVIGVNGPIQQYTFPPKAPPSDEVKEGTTTFLYSETHEFLTETDINYLKSIGGGMKFEETKCRAGHFWPMQQPKAFAERVLELL